MTGWFMALFYPSSPTSWIPEANGSPTASIMLDVLEIGKPQKKQKNLLVFFEELNGCGISGMSHLCARTAWMESETKFSWRIPISTNLCIFGLKSNYMQHVGRQEGEKKADKNNFISWNEKVSSNLSMYYISLCYYIYISHQYIYISLYSPKKKGIMISATRYQPCCPGANALRMPLSRKPVGGVFRPSGTASSFQ